MTDHEIIIVTSLFLIAVAIWGVICMVQVTLRKIMAILKRKS
jgi:hypothetical protein